MENITAYITLVDQKMLAPKYQTKGSLAIDLYSRIDMEIPAKTIGFVPLNIIIKSPPEYGFFVLPRSSTPKKKNLLIPHGMGIIDHVFCGEQNEVTFECYNFSEKTVSVKKGERIAQGIFLKTAVCNIEIKKKVKKKSRGAFGSTG